MTYRELYEKAERQLEKGEITSGEFDEMTKPLDEQIRPNGKWEKGACTNCGAECFEDYYMRDIKTEFCHRCGADMREGEAE